MSVHPSLVELKSSSNTNTPKKKSNNVNYEMTDENNNKMELSGTCRLYTFSI